MLLIKRTYFILLSLLVHFKYDSKQCVCITALFILYVLAFQDWLSVQVVAKGGMNRTCVPAAQNFTSVWPHPESPSTPTCTEKSSRKMAMAFKLSSLRDGSFHQRKHRRASQVRVIRGAALPALFPAKRILFPSRENSLAHRVSAEMRTG